MIRIRIHGRGGQGIKTAGRVLGTALFLEGWTVQDSPRYGAERRGAPIVSYVRAARGRIDDRGAVLDPDLVVVADETLLQTTAADVLAGVVPSTVVLIASGDSAQTWRQRLALASPILALHGSAPGAEPSTPVPGMLPAGAAGALLGLARSSVERAVREETAEHGAIEASLAAALDGYDRAAREAMRVRDGVPAPAEHWSAPAWVDLGADDAVLASPAIHATRTSELARTGLWRTMRPVIDAAHCHHCWWVCSTLCPDNAIPVRDGIPTIDYDHCKGCLVCAAVCPHHAIAAVPEAR